MGRPVETMHYKEIKRIFGLEPLNRMRSIMRNMRITIRLEMGFLGSLTTIITGVLIRGLGSQLLIRS